METSSRPAIGTPAPPLGDRVLARVRAAGLRTLLVAVALVTILVRIPYMVGPVNGRYIPDSGIYIAIADDLLHGRSFHSATELRTPAYPLLLAGITKLPRTLDGDTVVLQSLVGVALTLTLVWAAWRFFGPPAGLLTALMGATSPVLVNLEGDLMPEFFVGALATFGAIVLVRALDRGPPRLRLVATAGVLFGLAALVKPVGQGLLVLAIIPVLADPRRLRRAAVAGAVLACAFLVTISPWLVRNAIDYGDVRLSVQDGPALWLREFDWDLRPIPTGSPDDALARKLYVASAARTPGSHPLNTYEFVLEDLEAHYGYSERAATAFQRRVALAAIFDAPFIYARGTVSIMRELAEPTQDVFWARFEIAEKTYAVRPRLSTGFSTAVFSVSHYVVEIWRDFSLWLLAILALPFTRDRRRRIAALTFGLAWLVMIGAVAATTFPDRRYSAPFDPMLWPLGSAAVVLVLGWAYRAGGAAASFRRPAT